MPLKLHIIFLNIIFCFNPTYFQDVNVVIYGFSSSDCKIPVNAKPQITRAVAGAGRSSWPLRMRDCCQGIVTNHRPVYDVLADTHHAKVRCLYKEFCLDYSYIYLIYVWWLHGADKEKLSSSKSASCWIFCCPKFDQSSLRWQNVVSQTFVKIRVFFFFFVFSQILYWQQFCMSFCKNASLTHLLNFLTYCNLVLTSLNECFYGLLNNFFRKVLSSQRQNVVNWMVWRQLKVVR